MSAEWKVGVTDHGSLAVWDGEFWRWAKTGLSCFKQPATYLRPIVLIDPEDEEQVERLAAALFATDTVQAALREYASPTPPACCDVRIWLSGESYGCQGQPGHPGPHQNSVVEATWGEES